MTKTKTPFFSFASRGTVADALTSQKRGTSTLLRAKPTPANPESLRQWYQRWLYQDYVYRWHQLTVNQIGYYQGLGSREHLTAFSYFMKVMLRDLPDVVGLWHLDGIADPAVIDFSRNDNTGTRYGALIIPGAIDNGLWFDGLDDYVDLPPVGTENLTTWTISFFFRWDTDSGARARLFSKSDATLVDQYAFIDTVPWIYVGFVDTDGGDHSFWTNAKAILGQYHHFAFTFDGTYISFYLDGVLSNTSVDLSAFTPRTSNLHWRLGRVFNIFKFIGLIDHFIVLNRVLDETAIAMQSERRYPL